MTNPKLIIEVAGDARQLERTLKDADRQTRGFADRVGGVATGIDTAGDAMDRLRVKSARAGSIGLFKIAGAGAGVGVGLIAASQAAAELGRQLEVTGAAASTTQGRLSNFGSKLLSRDIVGAFKALGQEVTLSNEQLKELAQSGASLGDLGAGQAGLAAAGFEGLAKQIGAVRDEMLAANAAAAALNVVTGMRPDESDRFLPSSRALDQFTGLSPKVREALLDAQINATEATDEAIIRALERQEAELRALLKTDLLERERIEVKEALGGVTGAIDSIADQIAAELAAKKAAAAAAAKRLAQELLDSVEDFRDAALRALDRRQNKLDVNRGLFDARAALRQARVLGGPETIRLANRDLQDALIARTRFQVESSTFSGVRTGGGIVYSMDGATFHIHGVQNINQLLEALRRKGKQTATATTGRNPG